jgi:hypothetical protein
MATNLKQNKLKPSTTSSGGRNLQSQLRNYKTRFQAAGQNDPTDTRNWLEKKLNLEEDQNVLFDIFEIIGRPQQALFGAIDAAASGENALTGAKEGFTGERKVSGKDLLVNHLGMNDNEGLFNDASDFLGLGLDILLDPADLALLGVTAATGGATAPALVAKVGGDVAQGANAARKVAKAVDTADTVIDTAKALDKTADVVKTADNLIDTANNVQKGIKIGNNYVTLAPFQKGSKSLNDLAFGAMGKAVKGGFKLGDSALESVLGATDKLNDSRITKYAQKYDTTLEEAAKKLGLGTEKLQTYKDIKQSVSRMVDSAKNVKGLKGKFREIDNYSDLENYVGGETVKKLNKMARDVVSKSGVENADEAYETLMSTLTDAVEHNADWTLRGSDLTTQFSRSQGKRKVAELFTEEQAVAAQNLLSANNIKTTIKGTTLILDDDIKKLYNISDNIKDAKIGLKGDAETFKALKEANDYFQNTPELKAIYDEAIQATTRGTALSDALKGTQSSKLATQDYVKHVRNENLRMSDSKVYKSRKYDAPLKQVNKMETRDIGEVTWELSKRKSKAESEIYLTDDTGELVKDIDGKPIRDDNLYKKRIANKEDYIEGIEKEITSSKEILKLKEGIKDIDESKLTRKGKGAYRVIKESEELRSTLENLKKVNLNNVAPENAKSIKEATDTWHNYYKSVTKLKNLLKRKNVADDVLDTAMENVKINKQLHTIALTELRNYANDIPRKTMKEANKALNAVFEQGKEYQKVFNEFKANNKMVDEIYKSSTDMIDSLNKKLTYEKASLEKLKGAKDAIFEKKLKIIDETSKELNMLMDESTKEFFVSNFATTLTEFVNGNARYTAGAKKLNEVLVGGIFENPEYVKYAEDLVDNKIPYNFEKISGNKIIYKMTGFERILPEESKALFNTLGKLKDKYVYVDSDLLKMLDLSSNAVNQQLKPFLKVIDGMNNYMKRFSTLTLGFQVRNIIGNGTNMVLSGMPATKLPEYYRKATKLWNKSDELLDKFLNNTLTDADKAEWSILEQFYRAGFSDAFTKTQDLEEIAKGGKGIIKKVSKKSVDMNALVDRYNRLALLMYANDVPDYVTKLGKSDAIEAVKFALFDPSNMSDIERNYLKRAIPFYTFTKQNLLFQAENIMKNTPRYTKLYKGLNSLYNNLPEDSTYDYQKNNMQIPLPWADENGNQMFLKANLPVSDLGEYLSDPKSRILSSLSPIIRTPFELQSGKSLFTGEDLYYNNISKAMQNLSMMEGIRNLGISDKGITDAVNAAETILSNFGLQNVSVNLVKKVASLIQGLNGSEDPQQIWAEIFRSVLQNTNEENVALNNVYDDLELYQNEVSRLKKQGIDIPTIREITTSNKLKVNNLKKKRASSK